MDTAEPVVIPDEQVELVAASLDAHLYADRAAALRRFALAAQLHDDTALAWVLEVDRVNELPWSVRGRAWAVVGRTALLEGDPERAERAFLGAGDVARVMYVNLATQYLVLLPGAWLVGVHLGFGLLGVWLVHQFAFRALNAVILTALWRQRRWATVQPW